MSPLASGLQILALPGAPAPLADAPTDAESWWDVLLGTPLRIALTIAIGIVVSTLLRLLIKRWVTHATEGTPWRKRRGARKLAASTVGTMLANANPMAASRRVQRTKTLGTMLRSITSILIWSTVLIMVLQDLGVNVTALVASAGVIGVALGFGAQSLVKDFISGLFMLFEDQYGVGDVVDLGVASGTIEAVDLRVTRLRDVYGTLWYIRNGEITKVGNKSQGWANAVIDIKIGYHESVAKAEGLLLDTARELRADPEYSESIIADGEVTGVEDLSADAVTLRLTMRTVPSKQWDIARELRRRIRARFQDEHLGLA